MIDLNGLTCSGSDGPVLEDVTLRLYNGTVYGVTGAGSRELLEILAGVRAFDGGTVNLDGFDLAAEPTRAQDRVRERVRDDVGVGVAVKPAIVRNVHAAQDQAAALGEGVDVIAVPDVHAHAYRASNESGATSEP